jgi:hypothetical protein
MSAIQFLPKPFIVTSIKLDTMEEPPSGNLCLLLETLRSE